MRGPYSTPITPLTGSLFHADPHTWVGSRPSPMGGQRTFSARHLSKRAHGSSHRNCLPRVPDCKSKFAVLRRDHRATIYSERSDARSFAGRNHHARCGHAVAPGWGSYPPAETTVGVRSCHTYARVRICWKGDSYRRDWPCICACSQSRGGNRQSSK